jgi:hypothetical protein
MMETSVVEIEVIVYQTGTSTLCCSGPFSGGLALPRARICFGGRVVGFSSLTAARFLWLAYEWPKSVCIPSSIASPREFCFHTCVNLSVVALEFGSHFS